MMFIRVLLVALAVVLLSACYRPIGSDEEQPIPTELSLSEKRQAAEAYVQAGLGHMRAGNYRVAQQRFGRALRLYPDSQMAHMSLALLYDRTEQWELAEELFAKALSIDPEDNGLLNNYGQFLCKRGDIVRAEKLLLKSAQSKFNSNNEVPYTNLAACMIGVDRQDAAERYLLLALESNPNFASALLPMIKLLFDRAAVLDARDYLQRFESLAGHSALSLWLGLQIEHKLGSAEGIATYKFLLRKKFPNSKEAQLLRDSGI